MKWLLLKEVHDENDRYTEYRPLSQLESFTLSNVLKTVNAFLNAGINGTVILGIYGFPVKQVHGFVMSENVRQDFGDKIRDALSHRFSPSVPNELVEVKFEQVYEERLVDDKNTPVPIPETFVVEVFVRRAKEGNFFKLLDDCRHHYRDGANNLPSKFEEMLTYRDRDDAAEYDRKRGIYSGETNSDLTLPLAKFGAKRLGRSKIHNAKIDTMRAYVQLTPCSITSDEYHEIRSEDNVDATSDFALANVINAFLNSGTGGKIYYGFSPRGQNREFLVRGLLLPRDKRDQFRLGVDDVIDRFRPRPNHALVAVDYVPVLTPDEKTVPDLYMIEVTVEAQSSIIYYTADFRIYTRKGARNVQIHIQQIRDMVIKERLAAWEQELRPLKEPQEALLIQLNDQSADEEIKTNFDDSAKPDPNGVKEYQGGLRKLSREKELENEVHELTHLLESLTKENANLKEENKRLAHN